MSIYLFFQELDTKPNIVTKRFRVISNSTRTILGEIWFKPQWRRYIFEPSNAIFDSSCLNDIVIFINSLMQDRKVQR